MHPRASGYFAEAEISVSSRANVAKSDNATTREHPLQLKKKSRRGKFKKIKQRIFLVGRAGACACRRWGFACTAQFLVPK